MKLWWRTKPAADEYVDLTDSSRAHAIKVALQDASDDAEAKILRVSGKPRPKGRTIPALVEWRSDRCNS